MKIKLHIVDNNWLEILLKQYFTDLIFVNDNEADIVITPYLASSLTEVPKALEIGELANIPEIPGGRAATQLARDDESFNGLNVRLTQNNQVWQLSKPIIIKEVINIIEQVQKKLTEKMINIGPVKFYPDQRLCKFQEQEVGLTQKESEILLYLVNHPQGVDKATLLNDIWGYCDEISTRTLETHIYKLRNKFANKYELIGCDHRAHYYLLYSAMTQEEE